MIRGILPRLRSIAHAIRDFILATQIARLAIMCVRLWPHVRLPSFLLALLTAACIALAGLSAHGVFAALSPASPSGIGAGIAAGVAALVVLELCAFTVIAGIEAVLQLAHDFGRHRIGVLLALATLLAATAALVAVTETGDLTRDGWITLAFTTALLASTGWFQRTYRRAARRGFRDFHVDVVDARHFIAQAIHGG